MGALIPRSFSNNLPVPVLVEPYATPLPSKRQSAAGCRYPDGRARESTENCDHMGGCAHGSSMVDSRGGQNLSWNTGDGQSVSRRTENQIVARDKPERDFGCAEIRAAIATVPTGQMEPLHIFNQYL